ncbi:MAG: Xaa-Pro peptidase family protein [Candidatus Paceibacterota bacterium]
MAQVFPYQKRLAQIAKQLKTEEAILVSKSTDIFYLTGFPQLTPTEREAFLLIKADQAILFQHSFSPTLPIKPWLKSVTKNNFSEIALWLTDVQKLLIDEDTLTVSEFKQLKKNIDLPLSSLDQKWFWQLRMIKDKQEIARLQRAGLIAVKVYEKIIQRLKPGLTEQEVASQLAELVSAEQALGLAFPTIVAFGENGALPHYQPQDFKLKQEMPVLIDFGANFGGYYSDMTRTIWFGKRPSAKFLEVEKAVKTAHQQVLARLTTHNLKSKTQKNHSKNLSIIELSAKDLDGAARGEIARRGFGPQFIHTTGHGLGLEIHEPPSLSWNNHTLIKPGMVFTIEPGIYLPGEFGYRHEDTVLITDKDVKILTAV